MKRNIKFIPIFLITLLLLTSCNGDSTINLVSREDGSGTRGAFVEIIGLLEKGDNTEIDRTYNEAIIQNTTDGVMTTVQGDKNAIGYISTGSLNENIKTLAVNGIRPTQENIKLGEYPISRPFILAYDANLSEIEEDFLKFILSVKGQEIVKGESYITIDTFDEYKPTNLSGNITISGSTSVTPVIEKLKEEYERLNSKVSIELQSNGSSTGIQSTMEGASNFAMSSRPLKPDEESKLEASVIALDGIAIIVNKDNPINDISLDTIKDIFSGEITDWEHIPK